jgi:hypothetical protein
MLLGGFFFLLSGCFNMAGDVTPPPATTLFDQVEFTAVPSLEPTRQVSQPAELAEGDLLSGTVNVEVIDHSGGTLLNQGLDVILEGFDHFDSVYQKAQPLSGTGTVTFNGVPYQTGRIFFASINHAGAVYRSVISEMESESSSLFLLVNIWETTTDDSRLVIDRVHILVDYPQPDLVRIGEVIIMSNTGEKTVVAEAAADPAVSFPLPVGATSIEFDNGALGQRYLRTQDGFGDTVSIPPGDGVYQVLVYFSLPYQNNKLEFIQKLNYPSEAVVVLMPVGELQLRGGILEDLGVQEIQGDPVQVYSGGAFNQGELLQFEIFGQSEEIIPLEQTSPEPFRNYWIGLAALGTGMTLTGIWLYIRNRKSREEGLDQEGILDSIIALEDLFDKGDISEKAFREKRDQLLAKLRSLTEEGNSKS